MLVALPSVGSNLKRLREAAGYETAAEFARAVKLTPQRIADLETDRYVLPDTKTLMLIAKGLKCSVDDLLAGTDVAYDAVITRKVAEFERRAANFRHLFDGFLAQRASKGQPIGDDELATLRDNVNDLIGNAGRHIFRSSVDSESDLTDDERELIEIWRELPRIDQDSFRNLMAGRSRTRSDKRARLEKVKAKGGR